MEILSHFEQKKRTVSRPNAHTLSAGGSHVISDGSICWAERIHTYYSLYVLGLTHKIDGRSVSASLPILLFPFNCTIYAAVSDANTLKNNTVWLPPASKRYHLYSSIWPSSALYVFGTLKIRSIFLPLVPVEIQ